MLNGRVRYGAAVEALRRRGVAGVADLVEAAVGIVAETLALEFVSVWELLPERGRLRLRATHGFRPDLVGLTEVSAAARESQAGYTLAAGVPVVVPDVPGETRFTPPPILVEHGAASGLSVLIGGRAAPYGVMAAHSRRPRAFGPDEVDFFQAIAETLAGAIERERPDPSRPPAPTGAGPTRSP